MSSAPSQRVLAVDFGDARTGLAATDWTGSIVVPLPRIESRDEAAVVAAIAALVQERQTQLVVLGMPLTLDGTPGQRAQRTAAFRDRLQKALPIPIVTVDESHSTDEAHERLKQGGLTAKRRKDLADSIAALIILERHRQTQRRPVPPPPPDA
ncbi:MAG: Holliday junction resolvase RuvX [Planctomycetes bacterium]|nr:Holliday junction resolvase RuvX [Planctomycetota bacterium]